MASARARGAHAQSPRHLVAIVAAAFWGNLLSVISDPRLKQDPGFPVQAGGASVTMAAWEAWGAPGTQELRPDGSWSE